MFESRAVKYVLVVCLGFVSVCVCVWKSEKIYNEAALVNNKLSS